MALRADAQVAGAGHAVVLALVMVSAGAASFVLYALHAQQQGGPSSAAAAPALARRLIMLLGTSFSVSMVLLNAYMSA